jgi:hypothetical protein
MSDAAAGEPRDLNAQLVGLVPSACPACTLLGAGCARDAVVTGHTGNQCPVPLSAYMVCETCRQDVCPVDCVRRQETRMDRAMLLALALAAFRADVKSPLALQIAESVAVWKANSLALLNGRVAEVDGITTPSLNKRSLPAFTGFWQIVQPQGGGQGVRWAACVQGLQDALNIPGFLRKFSAVTLRGYTGAQVSGLRPRGEAPDEGAADPGALARMRALEEQVRSLQQLNQQQEESVALLTRANDALRTLHPLTGSGSVALQMMSSGGGTFQPVLKGSKYGQIDTRSALAWGKCHLTLENVLCFADCLRDPTMSFHTLVPLLCDACEPGKNKEQKIRIFSFPAGISHVDVPRGRGLEQAWEQKFAEFRSTLRQYGSEAVLCDGFYTAQHFAALYELAASEAQRQLERIMVLLDKTDTRVPVRCTPVRTVAVVDMIIKAALDAAFRFGKPIDVLDGRHIVVLEGFQSLAPTFIDSHQQQRKRFPQGERAGDGAQTAPKVRLAPDEMRAKLQERRAKEVCFNFNRNEAPCAGAETCPKGRKHICLKCHGKHAQSLTQGCK